MPFHPFQVVFMEVQPQFSVLSWNVRGAANAVAKRNIKELLKKHNPDVCFIFETHVQFSRLQNFWVKLGYSLVGIAEANGQAGGIWALGRTDVVSSIDVLASHAQAVTLNISSGNLSWAYSGIYASPIPSNRGLLWDHLRGLSAAISIPWVLVGDYNDTLASAEQRGGIFSPSRARTFLDNINSCGLMDIGSMGLAFTWFRTSQGRDPVHKRLDRALASLNWRVRFPEGGVEVLPRLHSDHSPLLLRCGEKMEHTGGRPFRFEAAWANHPLYRDVVHEAWTKGGPCILETLNDVRMDSMEFNKKVFGNIFRRKKHVENCMASIQTRLETVDSVALLCRLDNLKKEHQDILAQEEMLWFQKSREKWVKYGDRNTAFFHAQTIIRRKRNRILGLQLHDGSWCVETVRLQLGAIEYFKSLFAETVDVDPSCLHTPGLPTIPDHFLPDLLREVTREEVFSALQNMGSFKAPGPDGFHAFFYKTYWDVVGDKVFHCIKQAFETQQFDPGLGETLIVLIPKVDNPVSFKDFRPISLCNVVYKLLTKILVNRIRPILDDIISPMQSSFIPGRNTSDNAIALQEIVHHQRKVRRKNGNLVFKLDLEKAYDRVDWRFLKETLLAFGFPLDLVRLIMFCVSASHLTILWNGERLHSFPAKRGLRQGDPLSPYLFVLCMERFSSAISTAVSEGRWDPICTVRNGPGLSHLFFADDVLLFVKAKASQVRLLRDMLDNFCKASGLKVSEAKSKILGYAGMSPQRKASLADIAGFNFTNDIGRYLGFPIFQKRVTKRDFNFLFDRINSRLADWKCKLLNRAGRYTLAQSVLSAMPGYIMSQVWVPQGVCNNLDSVVKNFIWKNRDGKGLHMVGWNKITLPKRFGGLGLRKARDHNVALLGKHVWDIILDRNKPWVKLIKASYCKNTSFMDMDTTRGSQVWNAFQKARDVLKQSFEFKVGNGMSSFWYSSWCTPQPLCLLVDFVHYHDVGLRIQDVWDGERWRLERLWSALPANMVQFLNEHPVHINSHVSDGYRWAGHATGDYSTKSGYDWIVSQRLLAGDGVLNLHASWSWLWKLKVPLKFVFLLWQAMHDSLPTNVCRMQRGLAASAACVLCNNGDETVLHCLRDCTVASSIWTRVGFNCTTPLFLMQDHRVWFRALLADSNPLATATLWWIWRMRCIFCMENVMLSQHVMVTNISSMAADLWRCFREASSVPQPPPRLVSWVPRGVDSFMINVDGSVRGIPSRGGFGGCFRSSLGQWIGGFYGFREESNILYLELLGIFHGLRLAWDHGARIVECQSDSLDAVSLVHATPSPRHIYASLIWDIKDLLGRDWRVDVYHVLREGNVCADFLAKIGAEQDSSLVFIDHPLDGLSLLLLADAMGVSRVRP